MTRTFIALELNTELQRHLKGVIHRVASLLPSVHWVDPDGIHLTLAFLGELDDAQLALAIEAADQAAQQSQPFMYCLGGLGIFGPPRSPRVIWMGIEETTDALSRLHHILKQQLEQRGFETDSRPFSPHLTLARLKKTLPYIEQQHLQDLLNNKQTSLTSPSSYTVEQLNVMKSELSRSGAHYTCLHASSLLPIL